MPKIQRLSADLIGQIAAGEVVERPASVVKELVENAIDAEARSIEITLKAGGQELIAVSDDGVGMDTADAELAFERHATSKLRTVADLDRITTMGFRGEALPSIGAVARVHLVTATSGSSSGVELVVQEGAIRHTRQTGCRAGTTVEVSRLFAHTPARRKFLRSPSTELAKIQEVLTQEALAHPSIGFRLVQSRRQLMQAPAAASLQERVAQLFGVDWSCSLRPVEGGAGGVTMTGVVSMPPSSWPHRRFQFWFVNQRPIRNPLLTRALYDAYASLLRRGQHPAAVLSLLLDPSQVDVNIHPSKLDVRFAQSQKIYTLVRDLIGEQVGRPSAVDRPPQEKAERPPSVVSTAAPYVPMGRWDPTAAQRAEGARITATAHGQVVQEGAAAYGGGQAAQPERVVSSAASLLVEPMIESLGQLHQTYLLAVVDGTFIIVDQHAAHERLLFEEMMAQLTSPAGRVETQPGLLPQTIHLPRESVTVLAANQMLLADIGLDCEPFGGDVLLVRSTPAVMVGAPLEPFLADLVESLLEIGEEPSQRDTADPAEEKQHGGREREVVRSRRVRQAVAATMACHAAVKANQALSKEEMVHLLHTIHRRQLPPTCPHGRPIRVTLDRPHLEKLFYRR